MTSKVEMVDDQGYLEVKQNLRIDGDGRLIRVDVSRVLVNRRDGTRENEELRDQVLARCPDSEVANADVQVEASLAALHQRIAADRAFAVAHPDAAAIRDELLIQMRQIDQLRIGELPIRFANPHHLPLEAAGDGFRLTIPDMSLILGGDRLVIGTVASEFSLLSAHRLTVRSRIPEKITLLTENGQPSIEVVIGSRKFAGTWDRRLQIFTALDGEFIRVKGMADGAPMFEVDRVGLKTRSKDTDPDHIDIDSQAEFTGVNVGGVFNLARFSVTSAVRAMDIATFAALRKLAQDKDFMAQLMGIENMELAEVQALFGARLKPLARPFDTATVTLKAEGMKAASDLMVAGPAAGGGIGGIEFAMTVADVDKNQARLAFTFGVSGIHVPEGQLPPPVQQLLPERAGFTLSLERAPFTELWGVLIDYLTKSPRDEDIAAAIGGLRAVYPLMRNKSALALRGFAIEGPVAGVTADGEARIDPAAPLLVAGDATVVVRNLDEVINVAEQMGAPPGFMAVTALLTALGEPTGDQGSYRYRIAAQPDGKIMINERSLDPLLEAMGVR